MDVSTKAAIMRSQTPPLGKSPSKTYRPTVPPTPIKAELSDGDAGRSTLPPTPAQSDHADHHHHDSNNSNTKFADESSSHQNKHDIVDPLQAVDDHLQLHEGQEVSFAETIVFFIKELFIIPLLMLAKYFADYTNRRHMARLEQRYLDTLQSTEDFATWRETARALDVLKGFETWRYEKPVENYINAEAIVEETRFATQLYNSKNMPVIGEYLRTHLSRDANGLSHPLQFRYYTGTKACVEQYIDAVCRLIHLYANDGEDQCADDEGMIEEPDDVVDKPCAATMRERLGATLRTISQYTNPGGTMTPSPTSALSQLHHQQQHSSWSTPTRGATPPIPPIGPRGTSTSDTASTTITTSPASTVSPTIVVSDIPSGTATPVDTLVHRSQKHQQGTPISSAGTRAPHHNHHHHLSGYSELLRTKAVSTKGSKVPIQERFRYLHETALAYGRSALCLSGGASLGVYHAGVARGLFVAGLLPQIITGSSAGSIIGSIICCRTDDEIRQMFTGNSIAMSGVNLAAFEQVDDVTKSIDAKLRRLFQSGAFMDVSTLSECLKQNVGELTFRESFEKTGRILNISVSSASRAGDRQEKALLLNYLTSPNVLIWNAVSASCAMPGLFTAVELLEKDPHTGTIKPFLKGQKFYDGSVAHDIPKDGVATLFNVNYFIVSQTNPHVIPFLGSSTGAFIHKRKPRSLAKRLWFGACREFGYWLSKLYRFNLLPKTGNFAVPYLMHNQPFEGNLTIFPIGSVWDALPDYVNLTANPSVEHMEYVTAKAQRRTWPHLSQIFCVSEIERTLLEEIKILNQRMRTEGTKVELADPVDCHVPFDDNNTEDGPL